MNTLKDLLTEFCIRHPLILHEETSNKRLFLIENGLSRVPEFTSTLPENISPCVLWDLMDDGRKFVSLGKQQVKRIVYFLAQTESGSNLPDTEPEVESTMNTLLGLVYEFREFISQSQDNRDARAMGIDLNFDIFPYGPFYNGWYSMGVSIECTEIVRCSQHTLLPIQNTSE